MAFNNGWFSLSEGQTVLCGIFINLRSLGIVAKANPAAEEAIKFLMKEAI